MPVRLILIQYLDRMLLVVTACTSKKTSELTTPITLTSTVDPIKLSVEANLDFGKTETEQSFSVKNIGSEPLT